jgi:hypothetical protein
MSKLNLDVIKRKLAELSGAARTSRVQLWKPEVRDEPYRIRAMPWKNNDPSTPFIERSFYYFGEGRGILSLSQFGKPDPVQDFQSNLYKSG